MRAWAIGAALFALLLSTAGGAEVQGVRVVYRSQGVASQPDDAAWRKMPETKLALMTQLIAPPIGGGSVKEVAVRAMHDGEWLAIHLEWADATADRSVGVDTFRDAVAVGFPVNATEPPASPFMGDAQHPVAIWQWTADLEAEARGQGGFAERYPHTEGVWYFPQDAAVTREVRAWRGSDPVIEYVAMGFGTLARRPTRNVLGTSLHAKGRWRVVLRRQLSTGDAEAAAFMPSDVARLIVAVWNGSQGEVNGRKSVTINWVPFDLDSTFSLDRTVAGDGER